VIVLAIHDGHDAGATLLQDGRILLHSSEERRINKKNAAGVPAESVRALFEALFDRTGVSPQDVDLVALCGAIRNLAPGRKNRLSGSFSVMNTLAWAARSHAATNLARKVLPKIRKRQALLDFLAAEGLGDKPMRTYDHHLCHAACAYYHRPFEGDALVLTHDGAGDGLCATVNVGTGFDIRVVAQTTKYHSLANCLYSGMTRHLGLKPWEHEYKIMGMAPYGQAEYCAPLLRRMFAVEGLEFRNLTGHSFTGIRKYFRNKLAGQRFDNLCAGAQVVFEELMVEWVRNAVEATGVRNVCGAGGAFLNVKANQLIRESGIVDAFYAYPASDDGGTPIGTAILGYLDLCREKGVEPELDLPRDMYLGLEFSEEEMESAIKESGLPYCRMKSAPDEIASMLAEGHIVARFNGREEVGPRALGNRTIMADPRDLRVIRKLNFAIKQRDFWMPFAASVLEEDKDRYIKDCSDWAFWMIDAFHTTPEAQGDLIAGTHPYDMTVRPQIVNELNPTYRDIIRAFKQRTGVGSVLNTSFNLHGSPVVGTPKDALYTLENSALDALAMGPFLVSRRESASGGSPVEQEAATA
jgi:carbamoyltransferase